MSKMMKTPEAEKFLMNETTRKINLFNQALAKVIEDKIMIKEDSLEVKEAWNNYKDSRFLAAKNRHDNWTPGKPYKQPLKRFINKSLILSQGS